MKVSRKILKALIKECLLELLSEGLGDQLHESVRNVPRRGGQPRPQPLPSAQPAVGGRLPTDALRRAIVQEAGGDPVMQDILADTAMTTLPTRMANELPDGRPIGPPKAGLAEAVVAEMEPAQLVGEDSASRWASLAFETKAPSISYAPPPPPPMSAPVDLDAKVGQPKKTA